MHSRGVVSNLFLLLQNCCWWWFIDLFPFILNIHHHLPDFPASIFIFEHITPHFYIWIPVEQILSTSHITDKYGKKKSMMISVTEIHEIKKLGRKLETRELTVEFHPCEVTSRIDVQPLIEQGGRRKLSREEDIWWNVGRNNWYFKYLHLLGAKKKIISRLLSGIIFSFLHVFSHFSTFLW